MALALALLLAACGGSGLEDASDAGRPDARPGVTALVPVPPMPPAPPVLTPCPDGWHERTTASGIAYCDPWPDEPPARCAGADEMQLPGEPACRRIGSECPASGIPEGLPPERIVRWVRAGATMGDGSRERPFGTITAGIGAAGSGDIVAIGAGRYDEMVRPRPGITLWGACVAETILHASPMILPDSVAGVVHMASGSAEARNLTIDRSDRTGVLVLRGASLRLEDVVVRGAAGGGLTIGGSLVARNVAVRETRLREFWLPDGSRVQYSVGISGQGGAVLDLEGVLVEGNVGAGFQIEDEGSTMTLRRGLARGQVTLAGVRGTGVEVIAGATADVADTAVERNTGAGMIIGEGATGTCDRCVIRDTLDATDTEGRGVIVQEARGTLTRTLVERNRWNGVWITEPGAEGTLEDVLVRDTTDLPGEQFGGEGVAITAAHAVLRRVLVEDNRNFGVMLFRGGTATIEDVAIRGTRLNSSRPEPKPFTLNIAPGLGVGTGSRVAAARLVAEHNAGDGIQVTGEGSHLEATDVRITGTIDADPFGGSGLNVRAGATASIERAVIADNAGIGVDVYGGVLELREAVVERTLPESVGGTLGRGVQSVFGGRLTLRRAVIRESHEVGLLAEGFSIDDGTSVVAEEVEIRDTRARACASDGRCDNPAGHAVVVVDATMMLTGFAIEGAALCGVQIAQHIGLSSLVLSRGAIRHAKIAVCIQVDGFDLRPVTTGIEFSDNCSDVLATSYLVPEPTL